MKNLVFEQFCRKHFIQKDGKIGDLSANNKEVKNYRREQALVKLNQIKAKKQRRVEELYAQASKYRESEDNEIYLTKVKPIMEEAANLRDEVSDIQKKITKMRGK